MWIGSCFKASKETEAKVHSKLQDSVPAFHSILVSLMSGMQLGDRIKSGNRVVSNKALCSFL